jgi:hypothetical protein
MSLLISLLLPFVKDDEGEHWVTFNGQHILIGADGNPKSGNAATRIGMRLSTEEDHPRDSRAKLDSAYRDLSKAQKVKDIPSSQASALGLYTGSEYSAINGNLRSDKESACHQCPMIDKALKNSSIPSDTEVFRGGSFSEDQIKTFSPGSTFVDKGYVSTTMSTTTAKDFGKPGGSGAVVFSIHLPKGSKGLAVGSFSDTSEHEILLPRNSKFEVVSVSQGNYSGRSFKAVELKYLGAD